MEKKKNKREQKSERQEFGFMKIDGMEKLMKKQDRAQLRILIVTSSEDYARSLERAIKDLVENVESIDVCRHKEIGEAYKPGKYTHVIACDGLLSDEHDNVKQASTHEEAQKLTNEGHLVEAPLYATGAVHRMKQHVDPNLKKILLVSDAKGYVGHGHKLGVYENDNFERNRAILQQPIELKDLLRLLKE